MIVTRLIDTVCASLEGGTTRNDLNGNVILIIAYRGFPSGSECPSSPEACIIAIQELKEAFHAACSRTAGHDRAGHLPDRGGDRPVPAHDRARTVAVGGGDRRRRADPLRPLAR